MKFGRVLKEGVLKGVRKRRGAGARKGRMSWYWRVLVSLSQMAIGPCNVCVCGWGVGCGGESPGPLFVCCTGPRAAVSVIERGNYIHPCVNHCRIRTHIPFMNISLFRT